MKIPFNPKTGTDRSSVPAGRLDAVDSAGSNIPTSTGKPRPQGGGKVSGQTSQTPSAVQKRQRRMAQSQPTDTPQQPANPLAAPVVAYKDVQQAARRLDRPDKEKLKNFLEKNLQGRTKKPASTPRTAKAKIPQTAGLENTKNTLAESFSIYRKRK